MIKAKNKKKIEKSFRSTHGLVFEDGGPFRYAPEIGFRYFRIGSIEGLWKSTAGAYQVLAIVNNSPGNGHMTDFYQIFDRSCRRDGKTFQILEFTNDRFKKHLIEKREFKEIPTGVEKRFS